MKRFCLGLGTLLLAAVSCKPIVLDLVEPNDFSGPSVAAGTSVASSSGSADGVSVSVSTGSGQGVATYAIARRGADSPPVGEQLPDPEALVIFLNDQPMTCADPFVFPPVCDGSDQLRIAIAIPPELDRPGVIALDDLRVGFSEALMSPDCGGGFVEGHPFWGTLEIVSSDATSVTLKVQGTDVTADQSLDGDYVATRCGAAPVTPPPIPLVAVKGTGVTGNPSSGTGPTADPSALYLFFGTEPGSCAEPAPIVDCTTQTQVVLGVPEELQHTGEIDLTDPRIDAIFSGPASNCGTAAFHQGKLRITSIDAASVAIELFESQAGLDGPYAGTICP